MTGSPWLWLIAGPNGAGKSTYAEDFFSDVEEIVRPDKLATGLSARAPEKVAVKAGRLALTRISTLLKQRRTFAIETTLAGRFHLDLAMRAEAAGWKVGIVYIGLRDSNLALERVRLRHLMGGHNVPGADVRRRYSRSLKNLAEIYHIANKVVVLDNSSARQPMRRVLEANEGRIVFRLRGHRQGSRRELEAFIREMLPSLPKWLRASLRSVLKK
jgi:predicted ABC-type ATPase